jgi:putative salt-induced outer membrane protein YdiY
LGYRQSQARFRDSQVKLAADPMTTIRRYFVSLLLIGGILAPVVPASAQVFQPPAPAPDKFDWIQFTSGEWLKGEFIALYDGSLEFDSDQLENLVVDWADVRQVRTARLVDVRLIGEPPVTGRLVVDGDVVRISGDQERTVARANVLTIVGGETSWTSRWSGQVTFGANLRQGNTDQTEVNAIARALRRTVKSRVGLEYLGNYNVTNDVTATDNHRVSGGVDWFVTDRLFVKPIGVEYFSDPFQNISQRWTISAALGYQLVDTSRVDWEVSLGPAYQHTTFDSVDVGQSTEEGAAAGVVGTNYTNELTSDIDFLVSYQLLFTKPEAGRFNQHFVTGLSLDAVGFLDFDLTFVWDRLDQPRAAANGVVPKQSDYRLTFGLGFDF